MMGSLTVPYRPSDISTGLVGYWKFDNNANDSSSSGYNLTAVNTPTYTANGNYWKDEYCGVMNGSNQEFKITTCPNLNVSTAVTISAWVKTTADSQDCIAGKWLGTGNQQAYLLQIIPTTNNFQFVWSVDGANASSIESTTVRSIGKWQHIVVVYDSSSVRLFVDGNLDKTASSTGSLFSSSADFVIGRANASDGYFGGSIKDVAIWNVALTPLQVKSLALGLDLSTMTYRPSNVSTQPTHWWKLNEVSGNRADSVSTNPLTLTDNNTVLSSGGYVEGVSALFAPAASEYLSAADSADFDFGSGDFTVRWREYRTATTAAAATMARIVDAGVVPFLLGYYSSGSLVIYMDSGAGTWDIASGKSLGTCVLNTWNDFCVKRSGNNFYAFQNGIQTDTWTSSGTIQDVAGAMPIGRAQNTNYFPGMIEDLCIWKGYALTDAEIKSLACALPIQRQGIVSYWKMDEASGNALDSFGSNTGVETSGTIAQGTGKVGNDRIIAVGDTEYFEAANSDSLDIVSDMAILGWIKPTSIDITATILGKNLSGTGYGIVQTTDEKINFYIANDTDVSSTLAVAGTWLHFCGNYDGALKAMWANSVLEGNGAFTTNPSDTTSVLRIGADATPGNYADHAIDELVLTKRYFRPEEIKAVYLKGLNGKEATSSEAGGGTAETDYIWTRLPLLGVG